MITRGWTDALSRPLAKLAFAAAALAYAGWALTATLGDPNTSAELATAVLSDRAMAEQVLESAAPQLGAMDSFGVPAEDTQAIAEAIITDPRIIDAAASSIRDAHASSLSGDGPAVIRLPAPVIAAVATDAAAARGLGPTGFDEIDERTIELPSAHHLGTVVGVARMWPYALGVAALVGALGALAAHNRSIYVIRLARRVTLSATLVLGAAWAARMLATSMPDPVGGTMGAAVHVWRSRTIGVLVAIAVGGAVVWVTANVVRRYRTRYPALGRRLDSLEPDRPHQAVAPAEGSSATFSASP